MEGLSTAALKGTEYPIDHCDLSLELCVCVVDAQGKMLTLSISIDLHQVAGAADAMVAGYCHPRHQ